MLAAMIIAAFEGYVFETLSESTLLLVVFELVLPCLAGTGSTCEGVENAQVLALSEQVSSCQGGSDPVSGPDAALSEAAAAALKHSCLFRYRVVGGSASGC